MIIMTMTVGSKFSSGCEQGSHSRGLLIRGRRIGRAAGSYTSFRVVRLAIFATRASKSLLALSSAPILTTNQIEAANLKLSPTDHNDDDDDDVDRNAVTRLRRTANENCFLVGHISSRTDFGLPKQCSRPATIRLFLGLSAG